jgi:hypothetical protein
MKERVELVHRNMSIWSDFSDSTIIEIEIPTG